MNNKGDAEEYLKEQLKIIIESLNSVRKNSLFHSLIHKRIFAQLNYDPFFAETLNRHIDSDLKDREFEDFIYNFTSNYLNPSLKSLSDPFLIKDMGMAVERLEKALLENETICVYGDYDVDGITATSFLVSFLRELRKLIHNGDGDGSRGIFYKIPDRIKDGYGLSLEPIDEIRELINNSGYPPLTLLITVDLGITNTQEVLYANSKNIDVIICDHHEVPMNSDNSGEIIPEAFAVLNPKRKGDAFPFKFLPGVGIAFNLGRALRNYLFTNNIITACPNLKDYLDIVCLGIIADMVPMYGDNRTLTHFGLKKINSNPRHGIKELKRICGLNFDNVNESDIAWKIAPKINAAGRVESPETAVELLIEKDPENVFMLAKKLEDANKKRQALEDICFTEALSLMEQDNRASSLSPLIVLKGQTWHPGVIGIVSSRLVEHFKKPVLLLSGYKKTAHIGSARSCGNIDIYEYLKGFQNFFVKFGGHKMACGVTIKNEDVDDFIREIYSRGSVAEENFYPEKLSGTDPVSPAYDEEIDFSAIGRDNVAEIVNILSPYGFLNETPKFLMRNIRLLNISRRSGQNSRAYFTLAVENSRINNGIKHKALLFNRHIGDENLEPAAVDGIIFEFFNKYIKIINILTVT